MSNLYIIYEVMIMSNRVIGFKYREYTSRQV